MKNVYTALVKAKAELGTALRAEAQGQYGNYAPLDAVLARIEPISTSHGLLNLQYMESFQNVPILITEIIHVLSTEHITSRYQLSVDKPGPQAMGAAETYARRRSLMTLYGLAVTEDDPDAKQQPQNRTSAPPPRNQPPHTPPYAPDIAEEAAVCHCGNRMMVSKYEPYDWYCGKCKSRQPRI